MLALSSWVSPLPDAACPAGLTTHSTLPHASPPATKKRESGGSSLDSDEEGGLFAFEAGTGSHPYSSLPHQHQTHSHSLEATQTSGTPVVDSHSLLEGAGQSDHFPSLQTLAQRTVARSLVEPRSVLQVNHVSTVKTADTLRECHQEK